MTRPISTGTSTSGPITVAKATFDLMPNTAMATAIASSKSLLAAVSEVVVPGESVIYELRVTNNGAQALSDVVLEETVPAGLGYASSVFDSTAITRSTMP